MLTNDDVIDNLINDFPDEDSINPELDLNPEERYLNNLAKAGHVNYIEDEDKFWEDMKHKSMRFMENTLDNTEVSIKDRLNIAEKTLEKTGVLKAKDTSNKNTIVFTDNSINQLLTGLKGLSFSKKQEMIDVTEGD